jgi:hypothetical protein
MDLRRVETSHHIFYHKIVQSVYRLYRNIALSCYIGIIYSIANFGGHYIGIPCDDAHYMYDFSFNFLCQS